ncbi:MAG TPA: hypothetical protein VE954_35185 [Oligoflexus sp.]|uniref:hypothetical protein n=1 Tax=Oligoflexus sp. TaxID=1971216 RepID=UPI002D403A67|nr:hypothetical protein [Oligoflexus sp.]HYX38377.1 hypothetical protein [Oligoflexus sp.]
MTETPPKRGRRPRIEKDIFGDEYLAGRRVFSLTLDESRLPEGARQLLCAISTMNVDDVNLVQVFSDAIKVVEPDFWSNKIDDLTPFEWKLFMALDDPTFREQVKALLETHVP